MRCDFLELAAPGVRSLQPYQPGKPESELRREYGLKRIIKLASNENPLGASPRALAAARESFADLARYPDGSGFELKAVLAERHNVPAECFTLGNGSNDVLDMVARAFLGPAWEAVFSEHAFAVYAIVTLASGAGARVAKANPAEHPMPYGHDLAAMRDQITERTRVVFIANPNNPTGTWLGADALESFLESLPAHSLVVLDEAYFEYAEDADYPNALSWVARFPNLIVTRTFSKAYGLAGLRVGFAVSHPQVAELLNRVRQPFNVSVPALAAAVAVLEDQEYLELSRNTNRAGLKQLRTAFDELNLQYLPSGGNFLCVDAGRPGREVFQALLLKGIIVRPVDNYGLPRFLRITIGTVQENQALVEALREILGS